MAEICHVLSQAQLDSKRKVRGAKKETIDDVVGDVGLSMPIYGDDVVDDVVGHARRWNKAITSDYVDYVAITWVWPEATQ